ncbi:hypothetical protein ACFLTL_00995 [Chloroflexota bacterium]
MHWRPFIILLSFVLAALIVGFVGWLIQPLELKWAAAATGLALIALGLGVNSFMISLHTDRRINEVNTTLTRIETTQTEIQREQKEQSSSSSTIAPTLQAFSQIYLDYFAKHKSEEEQQNYSDDAEGS